MPERAVADWCRGQARFCLSRRTTNIGATARIRWEFHGGTCDNPRAQKLLTTFVVTAAASCYILWKGAFATAMDDSSADRFKEPGGIACLAVGCGLMCVVFYLLAMLAREVQTHESRPATVKKTITKTKSKKSCESYFIDEDAPDLFKAPGLDSESSTPAPSTRRVPFKHRRPLVHGHGDHHQFLPHGPVQVVPGP